MPVVNEKSRKRLRVRNDDDDTNDGSYILRVACNEGHYRKVVVADDSTSRIEIIPRLVTGTSFALDVILRA